MGTGAGIHACGEAGATSGCIEELRNSSNARHAVGHGVVHHEQP